MGVPAHQLARAGHGDGRRRLERGSRAIRRPISVGKSGHRRSWLIAIAGTQRSPLRSRRLQAGIERERAPMRGAAGRCERAIAAWPRFAAGETAASRPLAGLRASIEGHVELLPGLMMAPPGRGSAFYPAEGQPSRDGKGMIVRPRGALTGRHLGSERHGRALGRAHRRPTGGVRSDCRRRRIPPRRRYTRAVSRAHRANCAGHSGPRRGSGPARQRSSTAFRRPSRLVCTQGILLLTRTDSWLARAAHARSPACSPPRLPLRCGHATRCALWLPVPTP